MRKSQRRRVAPQTSDLRERTSVNMWEGFRSLGRTGCVLLVALLACNRAHVTEDLIGTWEGESRNLSSVVVSFAKDGKFKLQYQDTDGAEVCFTGDYEVDFSKTPVPLSIRNIPRLPHPLHTIIRYEAPDSLRMGRLAHRWRLRPIAFDPATEILLVRCSKGHPRISGCGDHSTRPARRSRAWPRFRR